MNWYQMESQEVMDKLNRFKDRGLSQKKLSNARDNMEKMNCKAKKVPDFSVSLPRSLKIL